jgi:hypothetical protein
MAGSQHGAGDDDAAGTEAVPHPSTEVALTVILLVASGVVLFLRFYHSPFRVSGAVIRQHTLAGC